MTAIAAERSHLMRWAASAVVVVGLHGLGVAALLASHDPVGVGDESPAVVIDLAPYVAPSESTEDLAPGPLQQQAAAPAPEQKVEPKVEPKPEEDKVEAKVEPAPQEKIEVPPAPIPPVAALAPPPAAVEPPPVTAPELAEPEPPSDTPPAPATTAPPRQHHASVAETNAWHKGIVTQIDSHLAYPAAARARGQRGVVQVAFAIDRQGRVISSKVAHPSGYAALDQAALETLQKAQPFPPPPANLAGDSFPFTIPLRFRMQ
jgi:protein TonB